MTSDSPSPPEIAAVASSSPGDEVAAPAHAPEAPVASVDAAGEPRGELVAWATLLLASFALHYWALGRRALHHDESLHAYYTWYIAQGGRYDYTPMLHGPLQFYVGAALSHLFGDSVAAMRGMAAFFGSLLPLLALALRGRDRNEVGRSGLGPAGALFAGGLIAFSAPLLYYGRFFRNDVPFALLGGLGIVTVALAWHRYRRDARPPALPLGIAAAALGVLLCMKENALILWFTLFVFVNCWLAVGLARWGHARGLDLLRGLSPADMLGRLLQAINIGGAAFLGLYFLGVLSLPPAVMEPTPAFKAIALAALVYLIVVAFVGRALALLAGGRHSPPAMAARFAWAGRFGIATGVGTAILVYMFVFTDLLRVPETPFGVFRGTIAYWMAEHTKQRLAGPFHYYLPILALYHLPALLLCLIGSMRASAPDVSRAWRVQLGMGAGIVSAALLGCWLARWPRVDDIGLRSLFHMESLVHLWIAAMLGGFGMLVALERLWYGQTLRGFLMIWTLLSLLIYSYAGEKVPWLTVHIALPMLLWAGCEGALLLHAGALVDDGGGPGTAAARNALTAPRRRVAAAAATIIVAWSGFNAWRACFLNESNPRERLVFNQTTAAFRDATDFVLGAEEYLAAKAAAEGLEYAPHRGEWTFDADAPTTDALAVRYEGAVVWPLAYSWRALKDASEIPEANDLAPSLAGVDIVVHDAGAWIAREERDRFEWIDVPFRQYYTPPLLPLPRMLGLGWRLPPPDDPTASHFLLEMRVAPLAQNLSGRAEPLAAGRAWGMLWRYYWLREPFFDPYAPGGVWGAGKTSHEVRLGVAGSLLERNPTLRQRWLRLKAACEAYRREENWTRFN